MYSILAKVRVSFSLKQTTKPQLGSITAAVLFVYLSARWGWVVNATFWPLYPWERDAVQTGQEARWASGLVWTGAENLAVTEI